MLRCAGSLVLLAAFSLLVPTTGRGEMKYTATVAPAAAPSPPLKYRLLPDPRQARPGNAAALYYRTEAMFVENSFLLKDLRDNRWYEWQKTALKDLPLDEMERSVRSARHFVRELELAAQQRDCDWNLSGREEGFGLLIPDVQGFRMLAAVLAVKARLHIARGQFDEAIHTIQTGYALGVNLGKGSTLIHMLVGVAIVQIMNAQLETLLQQPGAPNLYWALQTLPRPLFDPRPILLEESRVLERMWPFLTRLDRGVLAVGEIQDGFKHLDEILETFNLAQPPLKNVARSAAIVALHPTAKTWLIDHGHDREAVEAMNKVQAVTLYAYQRYRTSYDEWLVWALAGESERHPGMKVAHTKADEAASLLDRLYFTGLLGALGDGSFVPRLEKIQGAILRVERRRAGLATIEALRLQAARDRGRWPEKPAEVTVVPLPLDPATHQPWEWKREGEWIVLSSPLAPGEKPTSVEHTIYRVGLREK